MYALALARALKVFTGDAMLPTRPCVKMDELRVSGCTRVPASSKDNHGHKISAPQ